MLIGALPFGLLASATYSLQPVRRAVCEYVPEAVFPPVGLILFFAYGACIGMYLILLIVPAFVLDKKGNRDDLQSMLGVWGARAARGIASMGLSAHLWAGWIIWKMSYG